MAQTIAMQRGGLSITTNTAWNTLWTQSSGIATRVIPNQFNGYFLYNPTGETNYFQVAIVSSAGSGQILSMTQGIYSSTLNSWQIQCVGNTVGSQIFGQNPGYFNSYGVTSGSTGSSPYGAGITSANLQMPVTGQSTPSPMGQFFLGNGDSVQIRCFSRRSSGKGYTSNNMQVYWNMTTITES